MLHPRAFHAYCIGTPKSGTHSIAHMFGRFRTDHEPDQPMMIIMADQKRHRTLDPQKVQSLLHARDASRWLEMESSHYLGTYATTLARLFPEARFILTIRDCISWMDSWFNHQLSRPMLPDDSLFDVGRRAYYDRGFPYTQYDEWLEARGLFPIRSYLSFWSEHNRRILEAVEEDRLLTVRTHRISEAGEELADFLGIQTEKLDLTRSHSFQATEKFEILRKLDRGFLTETAEEVCGELNDRLFQDRTVRESVRALGEE